MASPSTIIRSLSLTLPRLRSRAGPSAVSSNEPGGRNQRAEPRTPGPTARAASAGPNLLDHEPDPCSTTSAQPAELVHIQVEVQGMVAGMNRRLPVANGTDPDIQLMASGIAVQSALEVRQMLRDQLVGRADVWLLTTWTDSAVPLDAIVSDGLSQCPPPECRPPERQPSSKAYRPHEARDGQRQSGGQAATTPPRQETAPLDTPYRAPRRALPGL
jgi:hypothetical protein